MSESLAPRHSSIDALALRTRGYQYEMFERSLKGNVIVAMDTGSGKTHVALLRMMAEIDRCPPGKLVWFLAPTVALCTQQHASINLHLPSLRTRLLTGADNVDRWSEPHIWDAVLANIQVTVSTHAVLADALAHGFVKMAQLSLLIFDEAHHCSRGHPANKIMKNFYHPQKALNGPAAVPHVLGLSASPILRSKISELQTIEANLDSLGITPRIHRQELLRYVHRPTLHRLEYEPCDLDETGISSRALAYLLEIARSQRFQIELNNDGSIPRRPESAQIVTKPASRTRLDDHLVKFFNKSIHIYEQLGPWAADYFILESIAALEALSDRDSDMFLGARNGDKESLLRILKRGLLSIMLKTRSLEGPYPISHKVKQLLTFLGNQDCNNCSGLLFVRQRATVSVLCTLLSLHPDTKARFQCATFVGMSNSGSKKYCMAEILDLKAQRETLVEFRARKKNLIVATDVLEEGIDVAACNLVVCFDPPPNVKSFIQRRGRARQEKSDFALLFPKDEGYSKIEKWKTLEASLIQAYQNELRQIREAAESEEDAEVVPGSLQTKSGAYLTPDEAIAHLHHFCARLPHEPYVDIHPAFTFDEDPSTKLITATVVLPSSLNHTLRSTRGIGEWHSERVAARDAAFQAYVGLYKAGLLNENLLPLSHTSSLEENDYQEDLEATIDVATQFSPWAEIAKAWWAPDIHQNTVSLQYNSSEEQDDLTMVLTLPSPIPDVAPFDLYWNENTTFTIHVDPPRRASLQEPETIQVMRRITHTLSRCTRSGYSIEDNRLDFIVLVAPHKDENELASWCMDTCGRIPASDKYQSKDSVLGFIRTPPYHNNYPCVFHRWNVRGEGRESNIEVECVPLPKRQHFLSRHTLSKSRGPELDFTSSGKPQSFPLKDCTADRLPFQYARFSLFISAILQHLEILMIADRLRRTILEDVPIKDIRHIITAISAPSAGWITNYQQYECLGDTVLKFVVSYQLFCDNGNWHEGYLSERKNHIVSNQRLAKGALLKGLDRYIVTDSLKAKKWSKLLISEMEADSSTKRTASMKVVADVVEALIGAAFIDGDLNSARRCIHTFLPEIRPLPPPLTSHPLPEQNIKTSAILKAETIIGYEFCNKTLLLEALTHPSCDRDTKNQSYQRLEFLGDAVLDVLIMSFAQQVVPDMHQGQLTLVKTALVNVHFLGFLCLDFSIEEEAFDIKEQPNGTFTSQKDTREAHFWSLMRHSNSDISKAQQMCVQRYTSLRSEIKHSFSEGKVYPWLQLVKLKVEKFLSDIVESIIGAIFVDSKGSFGACLNFLERIGLFQYLKRVLKDGVDLKHPKVVLEQLTGQQSVTYDVRQEQSDSEGEERKYRCTVAVGDVEVASVKGCLSEDEAVVVSAYEAVMELRPKVKKPQEIIAVRDSREN